MNNQTSSPAIDNIPATPENQLSFAIQYALNEHVIRGNIDVALVNANTSDNLADTVKSLTILLKAAQQQHPTCGFYDKELRMLWGTYKPDRPDYTPARARDKFDDIESDMIRIFTDIAKGVTAKNREYDQSWLKRGGVGAFMMLARKIDRVENYAKSNGFDILQALRNDQRPEGVIDDLQDLIGYLGLVIQHHQFGTITTTVEHTVSGD